MALYMCNKTSRHRSTSSVCRCRRQIHVEKCICLHNYVIKTKAPVVTTTRGRFDTNPITTGRAWICRIHACSSNVSYVYDIKYYWLNTFWIKKSPFFLYDISSDMFWGILLKMIFETIPFIFAICILCKTWFLNLYILSLLYVLYQTNQCFADAHNTFNLFDKKGDGRVSTKELEKVFKSLALQINDEQLKEWADEMDEEGTTLINTFITQPVWWYLWFSSNICIFICAVFALHGYW